MHDYLCGQTHYEQKYLSMRVIELGSCKQQPNHTLKMARVLWDTDLQH